MLAKTPDATLEDVVVRAMIFPGSLMISLDRPRSSTLRAFEQAPPGTQHVSRNAAFLAEMLQFALLHWVIAQRSVQCCCFCMTAPKLVIAIEKSTASLNDGSVGSGWCGEVITNQKAAQKSTA